MEPLTADDPQTVGDFRLRARLGAGGMGRVYLATSMAGRFIALKVIHPQLSGDADFARRFRGEADAAQRVSGLYTAPVVAAGVDALPPWLATAFVPGPSLDGIVAKCGPLPLPALWRLGAGLAEALRAIHAAGLVHRDLKPPNVIMAADGPRVIDFGIARAVADKRMTVAGSVIGTPAYMSPEQVEGGEAGPATDVFALGCVLGFAASGASPFDGGPDASPASVMYRVARGEPDLAAVPGQARALIAACLAKNPAHRPDPGQVAAQCAAASGPGGVSPTAFWPQDVAGVIAAQATAVNAEVQALVSGSHPATELAAPRGAGTHPGTQLAAPAGPATHPGTQLAGWQGAGWQRTPAMQADPGTQGMRTATVGPGGAGMPGAPWGAPQQPYPVTPGYPGSPGSPVPGRQGTSRRGLLIGIGAAVAAVAGGGAALALSRGSSGPARPGTVAWSYSTGTQSVDADITVANGVAYFGGSSGLLYAVSAATGRGIWSTAVSKVSAAPAVASGLVFTSGENGDVSVFRAATGRRIWSVFGGTQLDPFQRDFATNGALLAVAPGNTNVDMYDASTGAKKWAVNTGVDTGFGQSVAMSGSTVFAFGTAGTLVTLRAGSGKQTGVFGKLLADDGSGTNVTVSGGTLYFGADQGPLYAVDAATGRVRWAAKLPGSTFPQSTPAVSDGMVYFSDNNGLIYALDARTGRTAWTYSSGGQDLTGPAAGGGQVYVLTNNSSIQQLDAATGKPGWSFQLGTQVPFESTPAVAGGLVLCGNGDGSVYAVKA
jgi:outer membrane protein assembly factor BamB